jgi:iron complex outermembrane receptor protein
MQTILHPQSLHATVQSEAADTVAKKGSWKMSTKGLRRGLMGATAMAGMSLAAGSALAQAAAANEPSALEELVVTAQRRAENVQDVPISITALSASELKRNSVDDVSRLEMITPGFSFGRSGSDARPAIRGVRTETISAPNDPTIGFYLDGVYQSRAQQALIPLFDLERVEIQRGPQGTLYGRNTFGGNISVVTQAPIPGPGYGLSGEVGDYNLRRAQGFLNLPVSDQLQIRISGTRAVQDGYVTSTRNPNINIFQKDETALRGALRWTPVDGLEVLARAGYWLNTGDGGGAYGYKVLGTLVNPTTGARSLRGVAVPFNPTVRDGVIDRYGADIGVPVTSDPYKNDWDYQPFERTEEKYATLQVSWDLGDVATLRSITGYTKFRSNRTADLDQTAAAFPAPGIVAGFLGSGYQQNDTNVESTSEELQFASQATKPLQWIVGAYALHDKLREPYSQYYTASTATALDSRTVTQLDTNAYAAYAQASYYLVPDKLRLTGGVRYTAETKEYDIANFAIPQTAGVVSGAPVRGTSSKGAPEFKKTIWRLGAEFFATEDSMLYGNISTGFRSGGLNNNSSNALIPSSFGPEEVTAYEIGSKNRFWDNRLQINAAAYYYEFQQLQISILDQATNLSYTRNAGAATSKGAEVSVEARPVGQLRVSASLSYTDAKYDDYLRPNDFFTSTNGDPRTVNLAGNRIPMSPKVKSTLGVSYEFDLGDLGVVTPYAAWAHSSSYFNNDYNTVLDRQGAYDKIDLSIAWASADGRYSAELYGHNLTDVAVLNRVVLGNNQRIQGSYEPPRMIGLKAGLRF